FPHPLTPLWPLPPPLAASVVSSRSSTTKEATSTDTVATGVSLSSGDSVRQTGASTSQLSGSNLVDAVAYPSNFPTAEDDGHTFPVAAVTAGGASAVLVVVSVIAVLVIRQAHLKRLRVVPM
ncbi:hypothetical protein VaNZ11_009500, partial [Volvox africanus]